MKVKICGITTAEAALHAVNQGADALGFVFAPSKREVSPEQAHDIISALPEAIWKVGVFVDETPERIGEIADIAGLTHIQLHGNEAAGHYRCCGKPLIKSISVRSSADLEKITESEADFILLDSPPGQYKGGNGISFDWNLATALETNAKVILAGGLSPENVTDAVKLVKPYMVDVSSGVESDGVKNLAKITAFIERAKGIREDGIQ
jgi:phosphoribosylanthranilate isomerase